MPPSPQCVSLAHCAQAAYDTAKKAHELDKKQQKSTPSKEPRPSDMHSERTRPLRRLMRCTCALLCYARAAASELLKLNSRCHDCTHHVPRSSPTAASLPMVRLPPLPLPPLPPLQSLPRSFCSLR